MNRQTPSITIIRHRLEHYYQSGRLIPVPVDRWQLAKLRWKAAADDGREFGFDLEHVLQHEDVICENDYGYYVIHQTTEPVLVINLHDAASAAVVAWSVGNLHQPLQVTKDALITIDDPAVRQLCQQQHIEFSLDQRIFQPVRTVIGHHHHHHHHHDH